MRVTVVGLGKVGKPLALFMQELGHSVMGLDIIEGPAQEVGPTFLRTTKPEFAYENCDAAVLIVPTPQEGDRLSSEYVLRAGREARKLMPENAAIVIASTLDPRDADSVCLELTAIYTPVFIRLGTVLNDLQDQPFLLVGAPTELKSAESIAIEIWDPKRVRWREERRISTDSTTAACAKLALNATLSARLAWINDVAVRAQKFGADPETVCRVVGLDPRIGPAMGLAGWPPSGPCLPRDLTTWLSVQGVGMAEAVLVSHRTTQRRILKEIFDQVIAVSPRPKILVIGLTYKEKALDYTNALGMTFAKEAARRGFDVSAYDREGPDHGGTPEEWLASLGIKKVKPEDRADQFDVLVVGFPGYPQECAENHQRYNGKTKVIDPWR